MARLAMHATLLLVQLGLYVAATTATLEVIQGRLSFVTVPPQAFIPVAGVATVELGGMNAPIYYFDCSTSENNGSGLVWSREGAALRFDFAYRPDEQVSRLDATGLTHSDLGVYTCTDTLSADDEDNDVSINITTANPAVCSVVDHVTAVQGQTVQLEVYASSFPLLGSGQLTWSWPNGSAITSSQADTFDSGKRLVLSNIQPSEAGLYRCRATIPLFGSATLSDSDTVQLDVFVPPRITVQPINATTVTEGMDLTLTCSAFAIPPPLISWERLGSQLPVNSDLSQSPSSNGGTTVGELTILSTRYNDMGSYRCVATHTSEDINTPATSEYSIVSVSPSIMLTASRNSQSLSFTNLILVSGGQSLTLECHGSGNLLWSSSNGLDISTNLSDEFYQQSDVLNGLQRLHFTSFTQEHNAIYSCQTDLTDPPVVASVSVTSSNAGVYIAPEIKFVLQGASTTLSATVLAEPSVGTVEWYHEDSLIDPSASASYSVAVEGSVYSLTVEGVSEGLLGAYTVVVTAQGGSSSANDTVLLAFPVFPTALVEPLTATVNEGDEVRFQCKPNGTGALDVEWGHSDGQRLAAGAQQNGNELVISDVDKSHAGVYICSVTNLAGTAVTSATLNVFHAPTAVISYGGVSTTSTQRSLRLTFAHGDTSTQPVTCSADGYFPPSLSWEPVSLPAIPAGIFQEMTGGSQRELRWEREFEYTDSGTYECVASNDNGTSSVQLDLLVEFAPVINSIVSSSAVTYIESTTMYRVPPGFSGQALTCLAFAWPPPRVSWLQLSSSSLPVGVVSMETSTMDTGMAAARLIWEREFTDSDAGDYFCLVESSDRTRSETSTVFITQEADLPTDTTPAPACSVESLSVFFQVRVLGINCELFSEEDRQRVATEFMTEITRVVEVGCSCSVQTGDIEILSSECSSFVEGAVVFQGRVGTPSVEMTSSIYCALEAWQASSPLVVLDNDIRSVDSGCPLQISAGGSECPPSPIDGTPSVTTVVIAASVAGAGAVVLVALFLICCIGLCLRMSHKNKSTEVADSGEYSTTRTQVRATRYTSGHPTQLPPPPPLSMGELPQHLYSSLQRPPSSGHQQPTTSPPPPPPRPASGESSDHIPLGPIRTQSKDRLIGMDSVDSAGAITSRRTSTPQGMQTTSFSSPPPPPPPQSGATVAPYQLPVSSMGSLADVGREIVQPRSQSASCLPRPPQFGVLNPLSSAYEDVDRRSASGDSFTRKYSEGGGAMSPTSSTFPAPSTSSSATGGGDRGGGERTSSSAQRQFRIVSVASPTSTTSVGKIPPSSGQGSPTVTSPRDSSCSEAPPPYSSLGLVAPSNMTVGSLGSSMLDNTAYERVSRAGGEGGDLRQWYHNASDLSINQGSRRESRGDPRNTNHQILASPPHQSRPDVQPYATIHNSAIPLIHQRSATVTTTTARTVRGEGGGGGRGYEPQGYERLNSNGMQRNVNRPQPYAEPVIKSSSDSLASFSRVQASANFETIVV